MVGAFINVEVTHGVADLDDHAFNESMIQGVAAAAGLFPEEVGSSPVFGREGDPVHIIVHADGVNQHRSDAVHEAIMAVARERLGDDSKIEIDHDFGD